MSETRADEGHGSNVNNSLNAKKYPALGKLLQNEFYLRRVLGQLVTDSFGSYSSVCRQWRRVCCDLRQSVSVTSLATLLDVAQKCPNLPHIHLTTFNWRSTVRSFQILESFGKLQRLEWTTPFCTFTRPGSQELSQIQQSFQHLENLTSLKISVANNLTAAMNFLRYLTALTRLELRESMRPFCRIQPFSELRHIEVLVIRAELLRSPSGELMFPSLTYLTDLTVRSYLNDDVQLNTDAFTVIHAFHSTRLTLIQAISHYASTLRKLQISVYGIEVTEARRMFQRLTQLDTLHLTLNEINQVSFYEAITGMTNITDLDIFFFRLHEIKYEVIDCILSLSNLQSLSWMTLECGEWCADVPEFYFSTICHLTKLTVGNRLVSSLVGLTQLVHLDLTLFVDTDLTSCQEIEKMSRLESLIIQYDGRGKSVIHGKMFQNMSKLKSLTLRSIIIHDDFFQGLSVARYLSVLKLDPSGNRLYSARILQWLEELGSLESLSLLVKFKGNPCMFLRAGKFDGLRQLTLPRIAEAYRRQLRQRFPLVDVKIVPKNKRNRM